LNFFFEKNKKLLPGVAASATATPSVVYTERNQTFALYSNSSFSFDRSDPNARKKYISYIQSVSKETEKLYGKAIESPPISMINASWFQAALNSPTHGYASVETEWNNAGDLLYL
jgi:hypothetical protein